MDGDRVFSINSPIQRWMLLNAKMRQISASCIFVFIGISKCLENLVHKKIIKWEWKGFC